MSSDNATERLRELLDERGVKWGETRDGATAFSDESGHVRWAIACGAAKCFFEVGPLTPEQAIAATLGAGTCHIIERHGDWYCDACGDEVGSSDPTSELFIDGNAIELWDFCPRCSRKVVDDVLRAG